MTQTYKKEKKPTYGNKAMRIMVIGTLIMFLATLGTVVLFSYVMNKLNYIEEDEFKDYKGHYVFIADKDEQDFWEEVYTAACNQAEEDDIYIEYLEKNLGVNYTNSDLFRVAINSSVDGIIYGGTPDDVIIGQIDEAVENGIGVVLLQNDADTSGRQCFVGVNNYELGQVYASQIAAIFKPEEFEQKKVNIIVNSKVPEGVGNLFLIAMEDYFADKYSAYEMPDISLVRVDNQDVFSVEEDIRNLLMQDTLPDAMICLNSAYTQCVYQVLVDLNKVGETQLVGYFVNDNILEAINKQIIYSTITIDTDQMGKSAVQALEEYCNVGYTNSYVPVNISVIGKKEAGSLINEKTE